MKVTGLVGQAQAPAAAASAWTAKSHRMVRTAFIALSLSLIDGQRLEFRAQRGLHAGVLGLDPGEYAACFLGLGATRAGLDVGAILAEQRGANVGAARLQRM